MPATLFVRLRLLARDGCLTHSHITGSTRTYEEECGQCAAIYVALRKAVSLSETKDYHRRGLQVKVDR